MLAGCGYRVGEPENLECLNVSSLSIPYVDGDIDGQLTDELIKAFASSGIFTYRPHDGALELRVKIINQDNKTLGWRFNRNKTGKRNKDLISVEGRRHVSAEVTLIDALNDEVLLGPIVVQADLDFDCVEPDSLEDLSFIDKAGKRRTSINFSLGQLDSTEGAYDDSWTPLSRHLARRILDIVAHANYAD